MKDMRLALACGIDYLVEELNLVVHQPKIKEVALLGTKDFNSGIACLFLDKSVPFPDPNIAKLVDDFDFFINVLTDARMKEQKKIVLQVLSLFFPKYDITFTPQSILLKEEDNEITVTIDRNNFAIFRQVIGQIVCFSDAEKGPEYNPQSKKAKEIANKLKRGRRIAAESKNKEGTDNSHAIERQLSILSVGLQMPISYLVDLTLYQFYDLNTRYQYYLNWDLDIRARLVPGNTSKEPIKDWMQELY